MKTKYDGDVRTTDRIPTSDTFKVRWVGRPNHTIVGMSVHYYYTFFSTLLLRDRELHVR